MPSMWESPELATLTRDARALAEDVATALCDPRDVVVEVLRDHLTALDASLSLDLPALLADQLRWERRRFAVVAPDQDLAEVAGAMRAELALFLPAEALAAVDELTGRANALVDAAPDGGRPPVLGGLARRYLDHVLRGDRTGALAVVTDALAAGADPVELVTGVLQPAQVEIGDRWERGQVSVAHEHLATAVTQHALSLLHEHLVAQRVPLDRRAVLAATGEEAHEVGLRIVADLLERAGWTVQFLGGGVPVDDLVEAVAEHRADVLALSVSTIGALPEVGRLVGAVRRDPRCAGTRVLLGGRPVAVAPATVGLLGADGWAADGQTAVLECERLVAERPVPA